MSEAEPASPCTKVCIIDGATGLCRGCRRTLAEIAAWPQLGAEEKRRILAELSERAGIAEG